jgi:hypothetical protein
VEIYHKIGGFVFRPKKIAVLHTIFAKFGLNALRICRKAAAQNEAKAAKNTQKSKKRVFVVHISNKN